MVHWQHAKSFAAAWTAQWIEQGRRETNFGAKQEALGNDMCRDGLSFQICGIAVRMGMAEHPCDKAHPKGSQRRQARRATKKQERFAEQEEKQAAYVTGSEVEELAPSAGRTKFQQMAFACSLLCVGCVWDVGEVHGENGTKIARYGSSAAYPGRTSGIINNHPNRPNHWGSSVSSAPDHSSNTCSLRGL